VRLARLLGFVLMSLPLSALAQTGATPEAARSKPPPEMKPLPAGVTAWTIDLERVRP